MKPRLLRPEELAAIRARVERDKDSMLRGWTGHAALDRKRLLVEHIDALTNILLQIQSQGDDQPVGDPAR